MKHLQQLRYIDAVARTGSIRRAAETMAITSTALNRRILAVEEDLGTPIFERLPNGVRLSVAGELFIQHVRQQLSDMQRVQSQIADLSGERRGHVTVRCGQALMQSFMPSIIARHRLQFPGVSFSVLTTDRLEAADRLVDYSADIAVVYEPESSGDTQVLLEIKQPLEVMMSKDHPLAGKAECRLSDCLIYPLALPSHRSGIRHQLEKAAARRSIELHATMESDNARFLMDCVQRENMLAFQIPVAYAYEGIDSHVSVIPLDRRDVPEGALQVCQLRGRNLPVAAARFADFVTQGLDELPPDKRTARNLSNVTATNGALQGGGDLTTSLA